MGTWGVGILADDDAMDVYEGYRRLYNQGEEHSVVRQTMERDCAELLKDSDIGPVFWLAVARAQWEFGALDSDVLARVTEIAEQGLGLERWQAEGSQAAAKRQKAIVEFLQKIRLPNPKPKKRKVERKYPAIFQPGDCLAVPLSNGMCGAVFVLAIDNRDDVEGIDYVGLLDYRSAEKPSLDVFQNNPWISPTPHLPFLPMVGDFRMVPARSYRKHGKGIERLSQLPVRTDGQKYKMIGCVGGWNSVRHDLELYHQLQSFEDPAAREAYFKIQYYALRVGPNQYLEFEPMLLAGYEDLKARKAGILAPERSRILIESLKQLVKFYDDWGKPDEVTRWRKELDETV